MLTERDDEIERLSDLYSRALRRNKVGFNPAQITILRDVLRRNLSGKFVGDMDNPFDLETLERVCKQFYLAGTKGSKGTTVLRAVRSFARYKRDYSPNSGDEVTDNDALILYRNSPYPIRNFGKKGLEILEAYLKERNLI